MSSRKQSSPSYPVSRPYVPPPTSARRSLPIAALGAVVVLLVVGIAVFIYCLSPGDETSPTPNDDRGFAEVKPTPSTSPAKPAPSEPPSPSPQIKQIGPSPLVSDPPKVAPKEPDVSPKQPVLTEPVFPSPPSPNEPKEKPSTPNEPPVVKEPPKKPPDFVPRPLTPDEKKSFVPGDLPSLLPNERAFIVPIELKTSLKFRVHKAEAEKKEVKRFRLAITPAAFDD